MCLRMNIRGYTAPEYAIHGQLSEKVDTYSYGVVVLEIISGRKSNEMIVDPGSDYLLKRVRTTILKTRLRCKSHFRS